MFESIPPEVQEQLKLAAGKIGNVIAETSLELTKLGFREYRVVAGSLFYNDPEEWCEFAYLNILVSQMTEDGDEGFGFVQDTVEVPVAIYSPVSGQVEMLSLASAQLNLPKCSARRKGKPCSPGASTGGLKWICKQVPFSGSPGAFICDLANG